MSRNLTIYEDVGQKAGQHDNIKQYCDTHGIKLTRVKLDTGDYMLPSAVSVDTKKGMQEIYQDIVTDHDRFRRELIRAQEDGIKLYILIEDDHISNMDEAAEWVNPRKREYDYKYGFVAQAQKRGKLLDKRIPKPPVDSPRLVKMMGAIEKKYDCEFLFCKPEDTGKEIVRLLSNGRKETTGTDKV